MTAFIGPSGCGKSTLLRCINRMNDLVDNVTIDGKILLHDDNIYDKSVNVAALRRRVGMVFQNPIRSPNLFLKMSRMVYGFKVLTTNVFWKKQLKHHYAVQRCGMK